MYRSWIALGESVLRFHGQIEPMLYYAGHNCVLPKPRDRRLPADVWVPLGDAGERARSPSVASRRSAISPSPGSASLGSASFPLGVNDATGDDRRVCVRSTTTCDADAHASRRDALKPCIYSRVPPLPPLPHAAVVTSCGSRWSLG